MSTKFVLFRTAGTNEPERILINSAHVRTVRQSGSVQVTLGHCHVWTCAR
jgi:hypothetical protein